VKGCGEETQESNTIGNPDPIPSNPPSAAAVIAAAPSTDPFLS